MGLFSQKPEEFGRPGPPVARIAAVVTAVVVLAVAFLVVFLHRGAGPSGEKDKTPAPQPEPSDSALASALGPRPDPPVAAVQASARARGALLRGHTSLALRIYARLARGSRGNLCFSPYSLSTAGGMVYGGARGRTARQVAAVFGFLTGDYQP